MCEMCLSTPYNPRCPNAPEPEPVHECSKCHYGIYEDDKYLETVDGPICKECLDEMDTDEWLELVGESLSTAKKEER